MNNQNGPADGGNGGVGGDVILQLDESLNTLAGLARYAWRPNSFGGGGGAKRRSSSGGSGGGTGGEGITIRVLSFRAENGIHPPHPPMNTPSSTRRPSTSVPDQVAKVPQRIRRV